MRQENVPRRLLVMSGLLLLLMILSLAAEYWFLKTRKPQEMQSPQQDVSGNSHPQNQSEPLPTALPTKASEKASEEFGAALQRAGIETQASPSP